MPLVSAITYHIFANGLTVVGSSQALVLFVEVPLADSIL